MTYEEFAELLEQRKIEIIAHPVTYKFGKYKKEMIGDEAATKIANELIQMALATKKRKASVLVDNRYGTLLGNCKV